MKVLFLKDMKGVGKAHEIKEMADGYVLNFLLPKNIVQIATPALIQKIQHESNLKESEKQIHDALHLKTLEDLSQKEIVIHRQVNSVGGLFAALHTSDIRDAIKAAHGISLPETDIKIKDPIQHTGEFEIRIGDKVKYKKDFPFVVKILGQ